MNLESFNSWLASVPEEIKRDSLWKMVAYRLALFALDIGWFDVTKLMRDRRTLDLANQLYEALGSIGANLSEGYSRGTGRDRARFYEYSLGSARESRTWYYGGRHVLGEQVTNHRIGLLTQIIRLILKMVPHQRQSVIREPSLAYQMDGSSTFQDETFDLPDSQTLLQHIPYPDD